MRISTFLCLALAPTATHAFAAFAFAGHAPSSTVHKTCARKSRLVPPFHRCIRTSAAPYPDLNINLDLNFHPTALQMVKNDSSIGTNANSNANTNTNNMETIQENLKKSETRRLALEAEIAAAEETKIKLLREALKAEEDMTSDSSPELEDLMADVSAVADSLKKKLLREVNSRAASLQGQVTDLDFDFDLDRAKIELRQLLQDTEERADRVASAVPLRDLSIFAGGFAVAVAFRSSLEGRSKKVDDNKKASIAKAVARVDAENRAVATERANADKKSSKWSF
eukprot:scaffold86_cov169-Chaetoceros_neogracile.AAC.2